MPITIDDANTRARQSQARATADANKLAAKLVKEQVAKERQALKWLKAIGWFNLSEGERHGSFLALERDLEDEKVRTRWAETSRKEITAQAAREARPKVELFVKFPHPMPIGVRRELLAYGLTYRKSHDYYEGTIPVEDAEMLASKHGGIVHRYGEEVTPLRAISAE